MNQFENFAEKLSMAINVFADRADVAFNTPSDILGLSSVDREVM